MSSQHAPALTMRYLEGVLKSIGSSAGPNWAEALTAVVSAIALLAVVLAVLQVLQVNRQMHREFESHYLQRYWHLMDRRSSSFAVAGRPRRSDSRLMHDYLTLCEDQIALRELGRVTNHTWEFWSRDIRAQCGMGAYSRALSLAPDHSFERLRRLLADENYDPLLWRRPLRRWRGL